MWRISLPTFSPGWTTALQSLALLLLPSDKPPPAAQQSRSSCLLRMLATGKDIVAPHVVMPEGRTYDLNSWVETPESLEFQVGLSTCQS